MAFKVERFRRLTPDMIERARRAPEIRGIARLTEWRAAEGFALRFTAASATYYLRHVSKTVWLGDVHDIELYVAERLAREARTAIDDGRDPVDYVRAFHTRIAREDAPAAAHVAATQASMRTAGRLYDADVPWTFERLRQAFLEFKVQEVSERYGKNISALLNGPEFDVIAQKRVCDIRRQDLHALRERLTPKAAEGAPRGVPNARTQRGVAYVREMMSWGLNVEPIRTGLDDVEAPWWATFTVKIKTGVRERTPSVEELARTIVLIERLRDEAFSRAFVSPQVAALARFVLTTGMRTDAASNLLRKHVLDHPDHVGWKIAHWTPDVMKGKKGVSRAHALPLPPSLVAMFDALWDEVDPGRESDWAFPSIRGEGHVAASALNQLYDRLRGKEPKTSWTPKDDYEGKPGPKAGHKSAFAGVNLLELYAIEDFWYHDSRRSIGTFFDETGRGEIASAILGHRMPARIFRNNESKEGDVMADVTSRHYSTAQRVPLKTDGMTTWIALFDETLERERSAFEPRGPLVVTDASD